MIPVDKRKYLKRLVRKEMKLPEKRCVVSVSSLDHHRDMLYREVMNVEPGKFWKASPPFVSLDEMNAPYWNKYFENGGSWDEKPIEIKRPSRPKRRSASLNRPKPLKRSRRNSVDIPKFVEPIKRKYGVCYEKADMKKEIMAAINSESIANKAGSSKAAVKRDAKPTSSSSDPRRREGTPFPHDDLVKRWMKGEFDPTTSFYSTAK